MSENKNFNGPITSTGKVTGTELEGTSLDINGNADISGNLVIAGTVDGIDIATDVAANTAKTGITSGQASAITANTAKTGITSGQASAITANTAKTGITSGQASAITANTAKTTFPGFGTTSSTALAGDTSIPSISGLAALASPTLTGTPLAPTAAANTNTTQIATTAYVQTELTDLIGGAPGTLQTLNELAAAINDDDDYASTLTTALATKLPLAGGTMSGAIAMGNNNITGVNNIQANGDVSLQTSTGEYALYGSANAQTQLYHNGIKKFETTSSGIDVTGEVQGDSLDIDGNADISGTLNLGGDVTIINSIIHDGDSDTYFGFHDANQWRVVTGGTERFEITNGGATFAGNLTVTGTNYGAYHSVVEDQYYFDDYNGSRNLSMFYKNSRSDLIRYQAVDNFEYWNGSTWVADANQESNVEKLLDGRQDTSWSVPSTYYKFRFTTKQTSSWPTMAMVWMQTSWSGSTYPGATMLVEEYDGTSWATKVTADFTSGNGSSTWGLHSRADTALHTGNGSSADTTRITIDFYGWSPSNSSYTTIPLQNLMITSNYAGSENTDYTNLFNHARNLTIPAGITLDGNTISGIDDSNEFTDDDAHIMTSAAVNDRIQASIIANTDTQDLSQSGNTVSLVDGGSVDISTTTAVAANTAKTGITSGQASAITANTAKTGITSGQASAITANTAKTGITSGQASAITANTAKTTFPGLGTTSSTALAGDTTVISSGQASAITANTAKTGITSGQASAITANTAKTGITSGQASAITANTAKTGITSGQASAITANTAKTGITSGQATAISDNTAKISYSAAASDAVSLNTAKTGITSGQATAISDNSSHAASTHAPSGATVNSSDATLKARANHTGTQTASTISDFDTEVSNNTTVTAKANIASPTFTGTVTSTKSKSGWRDLDWAGNISGTTPATAQGDVIYHASSIATTAGVIYYMQSNGSLGSAQATAANTSSALLVLALGTNANQGLLLRGVVRLKTNPEASPGAPIYLSTTAGRAQSAAPTATTQVVRVVGYQLTNGEAADNVCYFNPDNTWVELT